MKLTRILHHFLASIIFIGIFLLPGCAKQEEQEKTAGEKENVSTSTIQSGGVYRYPLMNNPSTLDPAYVQDQYGETLVHQIFDCLVRFDTFLTVLPALAETWQVEDKGKTYRFILRENARFHNGQPVRTEDVVFSISRLLRVDPPPAPMPHLLGIQGAKAYRDHRNDQVTGLEVIDDRVIRFRLEEPHVPFLTALGMYQASIVPKDEVTRAGDQFGQQPIGSGPFQFVSWETNKLIRLERFSDYHSGNSFLDGIDYIIYPGVTIESVLNDFRAGNLDEMPVYGRIRQELSTVSELQWFHRPSLSLLFYGIAGNHPLLKKPEVRKALSMAIDRESLVNDVYKGRFVPAKTILPPGMPGSRQQPLIMVDDIAKVHEFIKNAMGENAKSMPPLEIVSGSQSSFAKAELKVVRESWGRIGIPVKIKYIKDWQAFEGYLRSESVQIYRYAWFADMPDPDSFLYPLIASDSSVNYMRFQNHEVDRMLQTARGTINPVKRAELYQKIEGIILESSPLIPLFYLSVDRVYQPAVQGVHVSALGAHTIPLNHVWLKKSSARQ